MRGGVSHETQFIRRPHHKIVQVSLSLSLPGRQLHHALRADLSLIPQLLRQHQHPPLRPLLSCQYLGRPPISGLRECLSQQQLRREQHLALRGPVSQQADDFEG